MSNQNLHKNKPYKYYMNSKHENTIYIISLEFI